MKHVKLFVIIILFLSFKDSNSQSRVNFGIGYNAGTHLKTEGLGFVIGRYNDTRSYLTKQMEEPRFFHGMNFAMDFFFPGYLMDLELMYRKSDVHAEVSPTMDRRDFRYKVNTFNFGIGKKIFSKSQGPMGAYLGIDFSTISVKNYTRVYKTNEKTSDYGKINWDLVLGGSPFLQFVSNRITAKIYIQFMMLQPNYWDVNVAINPNTWQNDDYESNKGRTVSLGMSLRFNLRKNRI